jgi:hypothetical protein
VKLAGPTSRRKITSADCVEGSPIGPRLAEEAHWASSHIGTFGWKDDGWAVKQGGQVVMTAHSEGPRMRTWLSTERTARSGARTSMGTRPGGACRALITGRWPRPSGSTPLAAGAPCSPAGRAGARSRPCGCTRPISSRTVGRHCRRCRFPTGSAAQLSICQCRSAMVGGSSCRFGSPRSR